MSFAFINCSGKGGLIGTWETEDLYFDMTWTFTGNNLVQEVMGTKVTIPYTIKKNAIAMVYEGAKVEFEYKIEGDTLTVDMMGMPIEFTRVEKAKNPKKAETNNGKSKSSNENTKKIETGGDTLLVGTWGNIDLNKTIPQFTFKEDGTGFFISVNWDSFDYTWFAKNKKLTINYDDGDVDVFEYNISDSILDLGDNIKLKKRGK